MLTLQPRLSLKSVTSAGLESRVRRHKPVQQNAAVRLADAHRPPQSHHGEDAVWDVYWSFNGWEKLYIRFELRCLKVCTATSVMLPVNRKLHRP